MTGVCVKIACFQTTLWNNRVIRRRLPVMRRTILTILLVVAAPSLFGQSNSPKGKVNLKQLSSDQLKTCFDDSSMCGTDDVYSISDELARRLPNLPTSSLVACFDDWKICGVAESQASGWPISDELAHRGNPHELLVQYWKEPKWTIRGGIEHVAYHFDTPEVTAFMRRVLAERPEDGETLYWPVNYLAKKCDPEALKELATGRYRNQGCMQYEGSVRLFGRCKYRPAIPYLVETAVYDMCLNIVESAVGSLQRLYPDVPSNVGTLEAKQQYYCDRARQEGLKVNCTSK